MKPNPSNYLVAAAVSLMRSADNSNFESLDDLSNALKTEFLVQLDPRRMAYLSKLLESYGFISVTTDPYAGEYITPLSGWGVSYRLNKIKEEDPDNGIAYALNQGGKFFERAFANDKFWADLDAQIDTKGDQDFGGAIKQNVDVPASDRVVTLNHNQQKEISEPLDEIVAKVSTENAIDGDPTLLQIIKGQLKAGRELIVEGCFKLYSLELTLIEALKFLAKRYEKEAIGALASTLMLALAAHIGITP